MVVVGTSQVVISYEHDEMLRSRLAGPNYRNPKSLLTHVCRTLDLIHHRTSLCQFICQFSCRKFTLCPALGLQIQFSFKDKGSNLLNHCLKLASIFYTVNHMQF